ncbi:MAG: class I SAM-dependent methyltransferase [Anaerolineae bacterium]|nr:class I SAM-dependent methyltransferase [Anaerolineae bacterium]
MRMYTDLANWWRWVSQPEDYADEAAFVHDLIHAHCHPPAQTILELGSGGGNNASHLKAHYRLTLVDLSPQMLDVSQQLNPECEHLVGDMRTVRLERLFDAVFIHDAIDFMTTEADLRAALATAYIHCRPGGVTILTPDHVRETFQPRTEYDEADFEGRSLRMMEWEYDPDPSDTATLVHYAFMLREGDGPVQFAFDTHTFGLFSRADWFRLLHDAGFQAQSVMDQYGRDIFVGVKPHP